MPIYAYTCKACGMRFEELSSFQAPAPPCPACRKEGAQRRLSSFTTGLDRGPRSAMASVPFERARCCGGACRHG